MWLDEAGFNNEASLTGIAERMAVQQVVLALDLRGLGETQSAENTWYGLESADYMFGYLLDRSYTAMRAEDILCAARLVRDEAGRQVELVARGDEVAIPALLAAALEPDLFLEVHIEGDLESYEEIVTDPVAGTGQLVHVVHGALEVYDLPELRRVVFGEK